MGVSFRLQWTLAVRNDPRLPRFDKHFALALATWMDENGCCYPSIETLAAAMGVHERTVQRHLNSGELPLVVLGYLFWSKGGGRARTHEFQAVMPAETPSERHPLRPVVKRWQSATLADETVALRPEKVAHGHPNSSEPATTAPKSEGTEEANVGEGTWSEGQRQRDLFRGAA
jgi:Helix-turn-helix domain